MSFIMDLLLFINKGLLSPFNCTFISCAMHMHQQFTNLQVINADAIRLISSLDISGRLLHFRNLKSHP
jgi:hypothetical protein